MIFKILVWQVWAWSKSQHWISVLAYSSDSALWGVWIFSWMTKTSAAQIETCEGSLYIYLLLLDHYYSVVPNTGGGGVLFFFIILLGKCSRVPMNANLITGEDIGPFECLLKFNEKCLLMVFNTFLVYRVLGGGLLRILTCLGRVHW